MTAADVDVRRGFWGTLVRCLQVAIPVILLNAAGQALLIAGSPPTLPTVTFILRLLGSIALLTVAGWLLILAVHSAWELRPFKIQRPRLMLYTATLVVATAAAWVVSPYLVPPVLLLALTQVPAVVAGVRTPFRTTWTAFRRRPIRAVLAVILSVICAPLSWLVSLMAGFFVTGPLGSILAWLWLGIVALVLLCLWTSLLREET